MTVVGIREMPPLRLTVNVKTPSGAEARWALDEPMAERVPSGLTLSSVVPGGHDTFSATLPRKPNRDYADLERLSDVLVKGAGGQPAWEGRLEETPRTSGDESNVVVNANGNQASLSDDNTARWLGVSRDISRWQELSRTRKVNLYTGGLYDVIQDFTAEPDPTNQLESLLLTANGRWATGMICESWFDAGPGNQVASVYFDYVARNLAAGYVGRLDAFTDDTGAGAIAGTDVVAAAGSTGTRTETPATPQRFVAFVLALASTISAIDGDRDLRLRNVTVWGNHSLPKQGAAPNDGLLASDMIANIVARFCPDLNFTQGIDGTIRPSSFIVPHAEFIDPTTAAEMISTINAMELRDWAVWDDKLFYYQQRGATGRQWQARVGPSQLQETGPQVSRLWNGVLVSYTDEAGIQRTVGPPGSAADATDATLLDTDPENPVNKKGLHRYAPLDMGKTSTVAAATQVGYLFLKWQKLLDSSGQATFIGAVQDSYGIWRPAWQVRAGDSIVFVDASDPSPRRVIRAEHDYDTRTTNVDLDAPPQAMDALLERLGVVLVKLGLS